MKKLLICIMSVVLVITIAGCSLNSNTLTLKGDIQNNIISSNSTVAGKIVQMNKQQGEAVKKGDLIAVIDNTTQKYTVDQLQAVVNMKKAKLEGLQAGTRPEQLAQAAAQVRAAEAQLDLIKTGSTTQKIAQAKNNVSIAQEAVDAAQTTYNYLNTQYLSDLDAYNGGALPKSDLNAEKYKLDTSGIQLSTAKYQLANSKQQLSQVLTGSTAQEISAAKANCDAANAQLDLLQSGSTKQDIAAAQADLDQSTAQLNQAQNILENYNIVALADGIIISKNFELGDIVNIGSNIADVAVSNDLYVVCYVPQKYLDKIFYNQQLTVIASTGTQTGKVNYISLKTEYTPKDQQTTTTNGNAATKIKIAIKDDTKILKSGLTANVVVPIK